MSGPPKPAPTSVVCRSCGVPFTRSGSRSSNFYRTAEENDTCIVCREGLDPVTLAPLPAGGKTMKAAKDMTDEELGEAILDLAAPRARMAATEDLRRITDVLASLAVEAAGRMKERGAGLVGSVRNVRLHADGRMTADLTVNEAGARFVAQIAPPPLYPDGSPCSKCFQVYRHAAQCEPSGGHDAV